jgi:hypothetical protein
VRARNRRCLAAIAAGIATAVAPPGALAAGPPVAWSPWSASPVPLDETNLAPAEREALARCGAGEAGLSATARAVVERKLRGLPIPESEEIARMQRAAGEPHPWARAWVAAGRTVGGGATIAKLDSWLGRAPSRGALRRCGVASGTSPEGVTVLAVVAIDAFADLAPLPTRVRPGQWLTVEARLRVPARGIDVVLLGPSGAPRSVPASFDGSLLRARFAPERAGSFTLQVMADVGGGRRPVLEAIVFAGVEPPGSEDRTAPGEETTDEALDDGGRLARMITAARASAGLSPLERDPGLDGVARDHAVRMARARELSHESEDGDPVERLRAAGVDAGCVGENVAHASTLALAHRSLWLSPSHRANLLRREFRRVGVAVVHDDSGDVWVAETFASQ